ncbi:DUF2202 domain-containing protein [Agromyces arachidis]|uniref:DUF2202 domain-containing protein n=1 Tax=Agromyces arachidis TaxID=766966 RepID=UPI0040577165
MTHRTALVLGIATGVLVLLGIVGVGVMTAVGGDPQGVPAAAPSPTAGQADAGDDAEDDAEPSTGIAPADTTAASLRYLIEEEKLAHDVYVTLSERWSLPVFDNIAASEVTHQDLVAPLLEARDLDDPRSAEVGEFTDPALQAMYDDLVARGTSSLDEAVAVGVLIEQTDIADLSAAIEGADDEAIVSVMERLLAGSENHLRAFEALR